MKLLCGMLALACGSAALASKNVPYPKENMAEFVVEKLDITTLRLLKGRESWKEFDRCPIIGVDPASAGDSYGG